MKIKRSDLNRLVESYLKDHMLLTTSLSGQATLKEYSLSQLSDDIEGLYDDASDYVSDVTKTTTDVLGMQYDLITDYYTNVSFEQFAKDAASMTLTEFQKGFDNLSEMGLLDAIAIEVGIEIVATAAGGPVGGVIAAIILGLGPMFVPIGLQMLEGKPFDQIMLEDILEILQMGLDQDLITLEEAKAFLGGGEKLKIVSTINEQIRTSRKALSKAGEDLIVEVGWWEEFGIELVAYGILAIAVIGMVGWALKHVFSAWNKAPKGLKEPLEEAIVDGAKSLVRKARSALPEKAPKIDVDADGADDFIEDIYDVTIDGDGKVIRGLDDIPDGGIEDVSLDFSEDLTPPRTRTQPKTNTQTRSRSKPKTSDSGTGLPKSTASRITQIQRSTPVLNRALKKVDEMEDLIAKSTSADEIEIKVALGRLQNSVNEINNNVDPDFDDVTFKAFEETYNKVKETHDSLQNILSMKARFPREP